MPSQTSRFLCLCVLTAWTLVLTSRAFADAPTADDDTLNIDEDQPQTVDVLANDADPEMGALSIVAIDGMMVEDGGRAVPVAGGSAAVSLDRIVYLPTANFHGSAMLSYTIRDAEGLEATANLSVTVDPVNDAPLLDVSGPLDVAFMNPRFAALHFNVPTKSNEGQTEEDDGVGNGETLHFANAGIVSDVPVDVVGTVIRNTTGVVAQFTANGAGALSARLEANGEIVVRFDVFEAGTNNPVAGDFRFWADDLDGFAIKDGILADPMELDAYVVDASSTITINPDEIRFIGGDQGPSNRPQTALELEYIDVTSFTLGFLHQFNGRTMGGRGITLDGNFSSIFPSPIRELPNTHFTTTFTEGDMPVAVVDSLAETFDVEDALAALHIDIEGDQDGMDEVITIGGETFVRGVPRSVADVAVGGTTVDIVFDGSRWTITASDGGDLVTSEVEAILRGMTYEHRGATPTETDRTLTFSVEDDEGALSNGATSTITIVDVVCGDGVTEGEEACDDGNTDDGDGCSSACLQEDGFICRDEPSICVPVCTDSSDVGPDDGCTDPTPHCDTRGPARCVACLDADHCDDGNACTVAACVDNQCQQSPVEAGTPCAEGFCDGDATMPRCVTCRDTSPNGQDEGCSATRPVCDGGRCVPCLDSLMDGLDNGCSDEAPACDTTGAESLCAPCIDSMTGAETDDGCDGSAPLCTTGDSGEANARRCVPCEDDVAGAMDLGCMVDAPVCDDGASTCVACEDDAAAGAMDFGCNDEMPFCLVEGDPTCVACAEDADCDGNARCQDHRCVARATGGVAGGACAVGQEPQGTAWSWLVLAAVWLARRRRHRADHAS